LKKKASFGEYIVRSPKLIVKSSISSSLSSTTTVILLN